MNDDQRAIMDQLEMLRALKQKSSEALKDSRKGGLKPLQDYSRRGTEIAIEAIKVFDKGHPVHAWASMILWRGVAVRMITAKNLHVKTLNDLKAAAADEERIAQTEHYCHVYEIYVEFLKDHVKGIEQELKDICEQTYEDIDWSLLHI